MATGLSSLLDDMMFQPTVSENKAVAQEVGHSSTNHGIGFSIHDSSCICRSAQGHFDI